MDFSDALKALKEGKRVTNTGWNGPEQFIFMQKGYPEGVPANKNTAEAARIKEGEEIKVIPYIMMRDAKGNYGPWLASQWDLFSEAWEISE